VIAWIKRWGVFVLVAVGAAIAWFVLRRKPPTEAIAEELDRIREETDVAKVQAERGRAEALAEVERRYGSAYAELEERERVEAAKLEQDPVALARYLVRVGAKRR
jgi:hypothetical protein